MASGGGGRGFASMDPEKQHEFASKGGKASAEARSGGGVSEKSSTQADEGTQGGGGNRGFAAMDPEKQKEIASKGGRTTQAHRHGQSLEEYEAGDKQ